jgi:peptidyl-prolyl cis-trans isomerase D
MLDKFRENSRSIGTYLIFGAIIVVFVAYFGQGSVGFTSMGGPTSGYAAKVNGEEISVREFQSAYGSMLQAYKQQTGGNFDEAMAEQLGLKDTVLDRLVERRLLVEVAKDSGLSVSDDEVAKAVREVAAFQKDGQFDFPTYKAVLANSVGLTPDKFEEEVRGDLLREKMIQQVRQAAKASDEEVREEYRKDNDKAALTVVRFGAPAFMQQAKPTDAELKAYLASDEGKKAVEAQYKEQAFRFKQPKRVQAQHILVKVAEDAPEADVEAAKAKLADAKKQIEGGAEFAELAKQISEDPGSKDKGGDLGFFGPGTMAKPFEEAAFALGKGEMSDIVRTRFGLHLIKVNDVTEPKEQKLEEVQDQIASEILRKQKAKELAKTKAEEVLAQVKAGKSLEELFPAPHTEDDGHGHTEPLPTPADQLAVAEKVGLFNVQSEYVPKVGASADLAKAVQGAEKGTVLPQTYEVSEQYVVAVVTDRVKPDMAAFESKAQQYRDRVVARKEAGLVQDFTTKLREKAKVEKNPEIFAVAQGN